MKDTRGKQDNLTVWRDDGLAGPDEYATVHFCVIHGQDVIVTKKHYTLTLSHIRTFPRGKGFTFHIKTAGFGRNGDWYIGTDAETYEKAKQAGLKALDDQIAEDDRRWAELQEEQARLRQITKKESGT